MHCINVYVHTRTHSRRDACIQAAQEHDARRKRKWCWLPCLSLKMPYAKLAFLQRKTLETRGSSCLGKYENQYVMLQISKSVAEKQTPSPLDIALELGMAAEDLDQCATCPKGYAVAVLELGRTTRVGDSPAGQDVRLWRRQTFVGPMQSPDSFVTEILQVHPLTTAIPMLGVESHPHPRVLLRSCLPTTLDPELLDTCEMRELARAERLGRVRTFTRVRWAPWE